MTTRPRPIDFDRSLVPGLIAVGLFALMAAVFLTASGTDLTESAFEVVGFPDVSIVSGIGYALIGYAEAAGGELLFENTENFLVALVLIAVLLDAALDGALMLAKRDDGGDQ